MWNLILLVASYFLYAALTPKPPAPRPAELTDFDAPTADEGRPIPVVFGAVLLTGPNVVWYGDLGTEPIKSSGGKK